MNIDQTLDDIIKRFQANHEVNMSGVLFDEKTHREALKAAIHKAYKDAGYIKVTIHSTKATTTFSLPEYMTGAEWMERFDLALHKRDIFYTEDEVLEAARRASGIKEDTE